MVNRSSEVSSAPRDSAMESTQRRRSSQKPRGRVGGSVDGWGASVRKDTYAMKAHHVGPELNF